MSGCKTCVDISCLVVLKASEMETVEALVAQNMLDGNISP